MDRIILALLAAYVLGMPLAGTVAWMIRDDDLVLADIPVEESWEDKAAKNGAHCERGKFDYDVGGTWGPKCKYDI